MPNNELLFVKAKCARTHFNIEKNTLSVKVFSTKILIGDTILRLHLLSIQRSNAGVNGPRDFLGGRVGRITYYPSSSETQGHIVGTRKSLNGRKNIWHEEK